MEGILIVKLAHYLHRLLHHRLKKALAIVLQLAAGIPHNLMNMMNTFLHSHIFCCHIATVVAKAVVLFDLL